MVAVGYSTVGAIVASRLRESPIGWLFCAIGLIFGVSHFSAEYAAYALLAPSRLLPGGEAFAWLTSWVWVFGLGLIVFLDLLFPNGRLPSAHWRWFARFTAIVLLPASIMGALSPGLILSSSLQNPLGIEGLPNVSRAIEAFMYALVVVGASSMLARLRHAGTIERQQLKWFAYATAVAISGVILKKHPAISIGVDEATNNPYVIMREPAGEGARVFLTISPEGHAVLHLRDRDGSEYYIHPHPGEGE
jgi:hypothetical protein